MPAGRRLDPDEPRAGLALALARRRGGDPRAAVGVERSPRRRRATLMRRTSRPVVEVEHRDLAAVLDLDRPGRGDREIDRRARQRALRPCAAGSRRRSTRSRPCGPRRPSLPSAETASASGVPGHRDVRGAPAAAELDDRDASRPRRRTPASRPGPRPPRASARAARRPPPRCCARVSSSTALPVLVATITTRAWATAGTSRKQRQDGEERAHGIGITRVDQRAVAQPVDDHLRARAVERAVDVVEGLVDLVARELAGDRARLEPTSASRRSAR